MANILIEEINWTQAISTSTSSPITLYSSIWCHCLREEKSGQASGLRDRAMDPCCKFSESKTEEILSQLMKPAVFPGHSKECYHCHLAATPHDTRPHWLSSGLALTFSVSSPAIAGLRKWFLAGPGVQCSSLSFTERSSSLSLHHHWRHRQ